MSEQKLVYFSSKNQDVSNDKQTIKHRTASHWTVEKNWEPLASMDEVIDSLDNWVTLTQCVRWYSHEAVACRRVLSDVRWMAGVASTEKDQVTWCEDICNKVLSRNKQRAVSSNKEM